MKIKFKNYSSEIIAARVIVLLLLITSSCQKSNDMPPKMEGPEPEPHKGVLPAKMPCLLLTAIIPYLLNLMKNTWKHLIIHQTTHTTAMCSPGMNSANTDMTGRQI